MTRWLFVLALAACSKASESSEAKKLQVSAPPRDVAVPSQLVIEVEADGARKPPIVARTLTDTKPDFTDDDRKAWLIPTLVAEAAKPGSVVEATALSGVSVKITNPTADGFVPVLFLTRRGEVIASAVDPKHPFPSYHGQGGRLHRAGDSQPRVVPVVKLSITHP